MKHFDKDSAVHPRTVTEVSRHELDKKATRRYLGRQERVTERWSIQPDPRAWATALACADGDARRLEIIDEWNIDVHNDPDWREHRD